MTKSKEPIRVGVMGCGARLSGVIRNLRNHSAERVQVSALYDPDSGSQSAVQAAFGSEIAICPSEEALVAIPDLDWIFIGSPNTHHARQAVLALRAGKDVFCEKPSRWISMTA